MVLHRKKENRVKTGDDPTFGDAYTFVAIERNSKLALAWHLGRRTARDTEAFTEKINEAAEGNFQITTDGFAAYIDAVHMSLGTHVDFAQLIKVYATSPRRTPLFPFGSSRNGGGPSHRKPDPSKICTSHVERQNLTMRMQFVALPA